MRGGRRDTTHADARKAIRSVGWSVIDTGDEGDGLPDLMVGIGNLGLGVDPKARGIVRDGEIYWVEMKSPGGKLRDSQLKLIRDWRGNLIVAESGVEAIALITELRRRRGLCQ